MSLAKKKNGSPWVKIFTSKEVLALSGSYFTFGYIGWVFFSWFYIYLAQVRGLSLKTSAVYSIFPFVAMTLGSLIGGVASDWLAHHVSPRVGRCYLPAFSLFLTGILLAIGSTVQSAVTATALLACAAGALYLSQSSFWSVTADFAGEHSSVVSGTMNMACQIGGAVTSTSDADDCCTVWMAGVVFDRDGAGDFRRSGVAAGKSEGAAGELTVTHKLWR